MPDNAKQHSSLATASHPSFQSPEILAITSDPATHIDYMQDSSPLFQETLFGPRAIPAILYYKRPCSEPDSLLGTQDGYIVALGPALDGAEGRAHGGIGSLLLDHSAGMAAERSGKKTSYPPATAFLNVQYLNPIATPCVVVTRAWVTRDEGRKVFVKAVVEDGKGKVYSSGEALFIRPRGSGVPGKI